MFKTSFTKSAVVAAAPNADCPRRTGGTPALLRPWSTHWYSEIWKLPSSLVARAAAGAGLESAAIAFFVLFYLLL
jgi:hypothetical protein